MFRSTIFAGLLTMTVHVSPAFAVETPADSAAATHYSTSETAIGTLLDIPAAKAAIDKNIPDFSSNPQIGMVRALTLKQIQQFKPDLVTDAVLAQIDADLAKLPVAK